MQQSSDTNPLAEALAAFRATRSAYQSTSDQALSQLLVSLAEEAIAMRQQSAAIPSADRLAQPDLAALQAELAALRAAIEAQQSELARLRHRAASPSVAARLSSEVTSPPREVRPMDYWEQHIPEYDETTPAADLAAYQAKRRVRPEDVVLTAEDQARLERRRLAQPTPQWVTIVVWIIALLLFLMVLNGIVDLRGLLEGVRPGA
jgi:hypothetical protein